MGRKKANPTDNFAVIDCETDPFQVGTIDIKPFVWGFYNGEIYHHFTRTSELVKFLRGYTGKVFAHNGGKFDFHFLLDYADRGQQIVVINGRLSRFKIGKATLEDSYNLLPVGLARFSKMEFDYSKLHKSVRQDHFPEILEYLQSDCVNLYDVLARFFTDYGYNLTLAGAAMRQWMEISGQKKPKSSIEFDEKFRPYYFGGRCECFAEGVLCGDFKMYDIKSAYPFAMMHQHPITMRHQCTINPAPHEIERSFVHLKCFSGGAFPLRNEKTGEITYPINYGEFKVSGWEYKAALELGLIEDVELINCLVFLDTTDFSEYVNYFFALKDGCENAGDKAGREIAKLFLNSLYGRMALDPRKYNEYLIHDGIIETATMDDLINDDYAPGEMIGDTRIWQRPSVKPQNFLNVACAASITGFVRAYLLRSLKAVENPYYCDTDSIICDSPGDLQIGLKLGDWGLDATGTKLTLAGKKMYCLSGGQVKGKSGHKLASKGARLKPAEIDKLAKGGKVDYTNPAPCFSIKRGCVQISRQIKKTVKVEKSV